MLLVVLGVVVHNSNNLLDIGAGNKRRIARRPPLGFYGGRKAGQLLVPRSREGKFLPLKNGGQVVVSPYSKSVPKVVPGKTLPKPRTIVENIDSNVILRIHDSRGKLIKASKVSIDAKSEFRGRFVDVYISKENPNLAEFPEPIQNLLDATTWEIHSGRDFVVKLSRQKLSGKILKQALAEGHYNTEVQFAVEEALNSVALKMNANLGEPLVPITWVRGSAIVCGRQVPVTVVIQEKAIGTPIYESFFFLKGKGGIGDERARILAKFIDLKIPLRENAIQKVFANTKISPDKLKQLGLALNKQSVYYNDGSEANLFIFVKNIKTGQTFTIPQAYGSGEFITGVANPNTVSNWRLGLQPVDLGGTEFVSVPGRIDYVWKTPPSSGCKPTWWNSISKWFGELCSGPESTYDFKEFYVP